MIDIHIAKTFGQLLKGPRTLLVIGEAPLFEKKRLPKVWKGKLRTLLTALAEDLSPGEAGATASTLSGTKPRRLVLSVTPAKASRYNHPAHPEAIVKQIAAASLGTDESIAICVHLSDPGHALAVVNAVGRAFPHYSMKSKDKDLKVVLALVDEMGVLIPVSRTELATLEASREAARLVDSPPTELNPERLAEAAKKLLVRPGVRLRILVGEELKKQKLMGIYSVGKAAVSPPRMLVAHYKPKNSSGKHVALVGKAVTFDTGGLHLKGTGFMETMKMDMGGGAAVLGAFRVLVECGCPHELSLVLCIAENAIGPGAYKPDDILTLHSGKSVEINNTDAEGRLLLADGVSYASRVLKAGVIIDAATLTGAQLVALGTGHAAVMSNEAELETLLVSAGRDSGDLAHPLPFCPEFYKAEFKSVVADMKNSVKNRMNAQSSCAAQFVYNHIEDTKARWAHIDLAGPAYRSDRGTGYGVALISQAVLRL